MNLLRWLFRLFLRRPARLEWSFRDVVLEAPDGSQRVARVWVVPCGRTMHVIELTSHRVFSFMN